MSIAIAAHDLGFDLDICELDKDYFEAGKKRYETHIKQGSLFTPDGKPNMEVKQLTI